MKNFHHNFDIIVSKILLAVFITLSDELSINLLSKLNNLSTLVYLEICSFISYSVNSFLRLRIILGLAKMKKLINAL